MPTNSNSQPVYEIPPPKYSAERVLEILLDPNIPENKICKEKPNGVTRSGTYVVDTSNLKCVDDIKRRFWNLELLWLTSNRI